MESKVHKWRLPTELWCDLEREARLRKVSVSSILEAAAHEWLRKRGVDVAGNKTQRELHKAAAKYIGVLDGLDSHNAETAREVIRGRLRKRRVH